MAGTEALKWASPVQEAAWKYGPYPELLSGGFGCIGGKTRIWCADLGRDIAVEDLHTFNHAPLVLAWDGKKLVEQRATVPFVKGRRELFEVYTTTDRSIKVTDQHRFLTPLGWWTLSDIIDIQGDAEVAVLVGGEGDCFYDVIEEIHHREEDIYYDLHVPNYENYLADGFINHNSGKTYLGCMKGLWLSDTFPKNRGAIIRQVGKQLRKTTMATFRKLCPPSAWEQGGRWNEQEGSTILNNKSEIIWLQLDDPSSLQIIKGLEINWFFIDQAEENPEGMESIYDTLLSRLGRWDQVIVPEWLLQQEAAKGKEWKWRHPVTKKPVPPQYAMLACNPDSELHWLYRRFHPESPEHRDKYAAKGYKMFHMPSTDNRFLTDQNKANLLDQDESFVRRYVRGEWGFPEGAIHDINKLSRIEFDDATDAARFLDHLRTDCSLYRFMDHGDAAPTVCGWAAIDKNGNIFFYREYYQPNKLISYHREAISALSDGEVYKASLADPAIFNLTMQKVVKGKPQRSSVADEYMSSELNAPPLHWLPADNNEFSTRNKINEYLRVVPNAIHAITKSPGAPRIYFVMRTPAYPQGCFFLTKETTAQRRLQIGTIEGKPVFSDERDNTISDHGYDVVRYATAYFGQTKKHTPEKYNVPGMTYARASKMLIDAHKRRMTR